jgi:hypothetical protein
MKQTAVEWLYDQIVNRTDRIYFLKELEQAKEMEKEQIKNAWDNGWHEHMNPSNTYITSVKYYNETFKSE